MASGRPSCTKSGRGWICDAGGGSLPGASAQAARTGGHDVGRRVERRRREDAGRKAYLAAFHAAQALIFERTGKLFKTHDGVRAEFLRPTKNDVRVDAELRAFLSRAYDLKTIADYETGARSEITVERAAMAVDAGKRFVAHIAGVVAAP